MLVDSNILIYAASGMHPELAKLVGNYASMSVISKIEALGFSRLTAEEEDYFKRLFNLLDVLPVTDAIVERAIQLRQKRNLSVPDAIIAGTALCHHLPLITRNNRDFDWIEGLVVENPFLGSV